MTRFLIWRFIPSGCTCCISSFTVTLGLSFLELPQITLSSRSKTSAQYSVIFALASRISSGIQRFSDARSRTVVSFQKRSEQDTKDPMYVRMCSSEDLRRTWHEEQSSRRVPCRTSFSLAICRCLPNTGELAAWVLLLVSLQFPIHIAPVSWVTQLRGWDQYFEELKRLLQPKQRYSRQSDRRMLGPARFHSRSNSREISVTGHGYDLKSALTHQRCVMRYKNQGMENLLTTITAWSGSRLLCLAPFTFRSELGDIYCVVFHSISTITFWVHPKRLEAVSVKGSPNCYIIIKLCCNWLCRLTDELARAFHPDT